MDPFKFVMCPTVSLGKILLLKPSSIRVVDLRGDMVGKCCSVDIQCYARVLGKWNRRDWLNEFQLF